AIMISGALIPSFLLRPHGEPVLVKERKVVGSAGRAIFAFREILSYPAVSTVILYYAATFGVTLAIYPAFMKSVGVSDKQIELVFFIFGASRFATLFLANHIAKLGVAALVGAVILAAVGMLLTFFYGSVYAFAVALVLVGAATSIFYPVT